jgi:ADP-L-glycero-D-manno-heptose 6-epimerase
MIVITGAAGFIGSCLLTKLNEEGYYDIVLVDDFGKSEKQKNYEEKKYTAIVDRKNFPQWLAENQLLTQFVFHIGARTDTTEFNKHIFDELNLNYSKKIWNICLEFGIPLIYASSAATYGLGENGYSDEHSVIQQLKPLNPYGESKNEFDKWVLNQESKPMFWAGFKFFNVYGPNEYHKGRMASVVYHAFNQISKTEKVKLFRSHKQEFKDGGQLRDFIYVKDVINVLYFFMINRKKSGIYNLGTGKARTFSDLAKAVFASMNKPENIEYIDTPVDIRDKYQYYTQAEMQKLHNAGYTADFYSLEKGIGEYVNSYLLASKFH